MSTKLTIRPTWTFEIEVLPTLDIRGAAATLDNTPADSALLITEVVGFADEQAERDARAAQRDARAADFDQRLDALEAR